MKLILDENLSPRVARMARDLGVDIVSTHELRRVGAKDQAQLEFAASDGSCLVTLDRDDFVQQTLAFYELGKPHAGVQIITWRVTRRDFADLARRLARFAADNPEGLQPYEVSWLRRSEDA